MLLAAGFTAAAQKWSNDQLMQANTVRQIQELAPEEKAAVLYINLARMYPKEFVVKELEDYDGTKRFGNYLKNSSYKKSLIAMLDGMEPVGPLYFDNDLFENVVCFAKEQGEAGTIGHERVSCPAMAGAAECSSYGMDTGKDIAMQWLIDDKIESLGHRKACLQKNYTKIGVSMHPHKQYQYCAVADFR